MTTTSPSLHAWFCSDIEDIDAWQPESGDTVDYWLQLYIGEFGTDGSDQYQVRVVSADALASELPIVASATVVVASGDYSFASVKQAIEGTIASCARTTWPESAEALSRHFLWEYADHKFVDDNE